MAQSLGVESADPALMRKPPRDKNQPILSSEVVQKVFFSSIIIVFGTLYTFVQSLEDGAASSRCRTKVFLINLDLYLLCLF